MTILSLWIVFLTDGTSLPGRLMPTMECRREAADLRRFALILAATNRRLPPEHRGYLSDGNRPISHVECRPFRIGAGA